MTKRTFLESLEDMSPAEIATGIMRGIASFDEVRGYATEEALSFPRSKQTEIKNILAGFKEEEKSFEAATTVPLLEEFIGKYPGGPFAGKARETLEKMKTQEAEELERLKRQEAEELERRRKQEAEEFAMEQKRAAEAAVKRAEEEEKIFQFVLQDINARSPDAFRDYYNGLGYDADSLMRRCCERLLLDYDFVANYDEPRLEFGGIPERPSDVPSGFTDIFFWGMPSSGKTCALSVMLNTMRTIYTPAAPQIDIHFGARYRDSLTHLFVDDYAYLPSATVVDRTQYMPFRLKNRGEADRYYRNISFFELSGEIFKYIYDVVNGSNLAGYNVKEENLRQKTTAFKTLDLLLSSKNQKIHFFFIDHSAKKQHIAEQVKFLNAAATYFRDYKDIFKKRTDAVYIILTKADGIYAASDTERSRIAGIFLEEKFGDFIDAIKVQCRANSIENISMKIFSIGDVYFSKICKINRKYSRRIIDELLTIIRPARSNPFGDYLS